MMLLKACPRCHGDLYPEDKEVACLQCGYRRDVKAERALPRVARSREKIGGARRMGR